jgi:hypothetical protein
MSLIAATALDASLDDPYAATAQQIRADRQAELQGFE